MNKREYCENRERCERIARKCEVGENSETFDTVELPITIENKMQFVKQWICENIEKFGGKPGKWDRVDFLAAECGGYGWTFEKDGNGWAHAELFINGAQVPAVQFDFATSAEQLSARWWWSSILTDDLSRQFDAWQARVDDAGGCVDEGKIFDAFNALVSAAESMDVDKGRDYPSGVYWVYLGGDIVASFLGDRGYFDPTLEFCEALCAEVSRIWGCGPDLERFFNENEINEDIYDWLVDVEGDRGDHPEWS